MTENKSNRPLTYRIAQWHGFIFAGVFLLYGGVTVILDTLDRNYDNLSQPILFGLLGAILISFAFAYKEMKRWGWYALVFVNSLVVIIGLLDLQQYENIVLVLFSAVALYALFAPSTREYLFHRR